MQRLISTNRKLVIGVDASRNRSGGAKAHLIGLLSRGNPEDHGIGTVHVWAYKSLLDSIPEQPWLIKHNPPELEQSLLRQVIWQVLKFPGEVARAGCDIVLNTDAGTMSHVRPAVTMSRDMLSYEPGEIERYGWSKARLRLILLRYIQNRSLRRADGAIFLTRYAAEVIQRSSGPVRRIGLVPHGVGQNFQDLRHTLPWPAKGERPIRLLYISNAAWYKHQWMVVRAVEQLRNQGIDVTLTLVGGGSGPAQDRLRSQMARSDPRGEFVTQKKFVPQSDLPGYLVDADIFVFASSCENMPNILMEMMASGLPIVSSSTRPMPDILKDGGIYYDPMSESETATAITKAISDQKLRKTMAQIGKELSAQYSWSDASLKTIQFLEQLAYRVSR